MDPIMLMKLFKYSLISSSHILVYTLIAMLVSSTISSAQLSPDFYALSCPTVEFIVRNTVQSAANSDASIPGKLLRLMFHDCIVEGCDGSVLIQGEGTERSDPASRTLGGFDVVDSAKRMLEVFCPGTVSCADILVLAARDAVAIAGGPIVPVPLGRRDGRISSASNVRPNMVDTTFSVSEMAQLFSSKGLSMDDLVILSGAHTIGSAHCNAFSDRFTDGSNGTLIPADDSLDKGYATQLVKKCPADASDSVSVSNDPVTANLFDDQYYRNLIDRKGLFHSDAALANDSRTKNLVESLSDGRDSFILRWSDSFVKLSRINVKTGDEGEIRSSCMNVN